MNKLVSTLLFIVALSSCKNSPKQTDSQKNESADIANSNLKYLSSPADSGSAEPYLFTDKNGVVYLSWVEKTKEKSLLKFSA
ncbi:hypothetical protein MD537_23180, partial [Flavihumibacter sediminis]|nr:hypothetical protein [Flavihumibacter sediminis]